MGSRSSIEPTTTNSRLFRKLCPVLSWTIVPNFCANHDDPGTTGARRTDLEKAKAALLESLNLNPGLPKRPLPASNKPCGLGPKTSITGRTWPTFTWPTVLSGRPWKRATALGLGHQEANGPDSRGRPGIGRACASRFVSTMVSAHLHTPGTSPVVSRKTPHCPSHPKESLTAARMVFEVPIISTRPLPPVGLTFARIAEICQRPTSWLAGPW